MSFQTIQTQVQLLEIRLAQALTYKSVLALKKDIATLIIEFNSIEKSGLTEAPEAIGTLKENIKNLRASYKTKIHALQDMSFEAAPLAPLSKRKRV